MSLPFLIPFLFFVSLFSKPSPSSSQLQSFSISNSPWKPTQNKTLISSDGVFAAGFRPLPTSQNRYTFSIWYQNVSEKTVVWSANAPSPLDQNASLVITSNGSLCLMNSVGVNVWHPVAATGNPNSTRLILSKQGNLVYNGTSWQSFDYPTDTILPTQNMSARSTVMVLANGKFSFRNGTNLFFNSSEIYWTADNGFQQLDVHGTVIQMNGNRLFSADFDEDRLRRLKLDEDGNLRIYSLDPDTGKWDVAWEAVQQICTIHGTCGPNAICINDGLSSNTSCVCPPGFKKANGEENGCEIKIPPKSPGNFKFLRLDYVSFTGGSNQSNLQVSNLSMCQSRCLANMSCLGFQFKYDGKGYCVLQLDRMLYGYWSPGTQAAFFLRVDRSETDESNFIGLTDLLETTCPVRIKLPSPPEESNTTTRNIIIICTLVTVELISGGLFFSVFVKKYIKYRTMAQTFGLQFLPSGGPKRFTYAELKAATGDFSNLIGKGGFGDVYKGELTDHRIVAVKCLKNVTKGDAEFWAEVTIISRMHHLNLVRLWGFCAEKGQRILVYEYVPNGSLDRYLFRKRVGSPEAITGSTNIPVLDWNIRYRIALGVARAIAYLHEECLEWVLHCDIKPENILLGDDFCPKISDFGLAKLRKKEDVVRMSQRRGTRGYMAPEWLSLDVITPKADVYSFGMVLLEIVNGVRNSETQGSMNSEDWYLPGWAFNKVFKEMDVEDILDRQIKHCYDARIHFHMVDRMVKTAMWCLQAQPEMRPSMGKVAKMLEGTVEITEPKKPTIFFLGDE
ncbi:hypothetical protein SLE2022_199180 [Rubroshorea leprosula]